MTIIILFFCNTYLNLKYFLFQTTCQPTISPKASIVLTTSPHAIIPQRLHLKPSIKLEGAQFTTAIHNLPPTPPSCSSGEDSEDNGTISQPSSPAARKPARLILERTSTRQPIHTPLISSQPVSMFELEQTKSYLTYRVRT